MKLTSFADDIKRGLISKDGKRTAKERAFTLRNEAEGIASRLGPGDFWYRWTDDEFLRPEPREELHDPVRAALRDRGLRLVMDPGAGMRVVVDDSPTPAFLKPAKKKKAAAHRSKEKHRPNAAYFAQAEIEGDAARAQQADAKNARRIFDSLSVAELRAYKRNPFALGDIFDAEDFPREVRLEFEKLIARSLL